MKSYANEKLIQVRKWISEGIIAGLKYSDDYTCARAHVYYRS